MTTALEFVRGLGLGWNLGNTFDPVPLNDERNKTITTGGVWTPEDQQRLWFNKPFTRDCAFFVKEAGFDTIRIPVTWKDWQDPYTGNVDPVWMAAVQEAVDWSYEAGLNVIVDVHHDGGNGPFGWIRTASEDYPGVCSRFSALWHQIAERFRDYDHHLIFEGGNEICFPHAAHQDTAYELLNRLNQLFVDIVRASGGNNADRFLLIPGYNTDTALTCDERFRLPEDTVDDHLIVSIHYYSPAEFVLAEHDSDWCTPVDVWGSDEEVAAVEADFAKQKARFIDNGIPVIIGEYGLLTEPADHKDHDSNIKWLRTVIRCALTNGSCPILWDTSTKEMCFLNRETGRFFDPEVEAIYQEARTMSVAQ